MAEPAVLVQTFVKPSREHGVCCLRNSFQSVTARSTGVAGGNPLNKGGIRRRLHREFGFVSVTICEFDGHHGGASKYRGGSDRSPIYVCKRWGVPRDTGISMLS